MYKSAMLGCGGRARAHASAYRFVKGGKIAAVCDMNEEQLNRFGDDFEISSRYTDLDEMLNQDLRKLSRKAHIGVKKSLFQCF